jgi:hypothetical protein
MAGLIPVGALVDPKADVFASTAPHLDVRVIPRFGPQQGKRIDPRSARTLLQNVLVGPNKTPLVQQVGQSWQWNYPVTSEFGPRKAPIAGASTYHEGIDIGGLPAGTPVAYKGYGTYQPDRGFGTIKTTDPQGQPYDIQFLHIKPGGATSVGSTIAPSAPQLPQLDGAQQATDTRTRDILEAFMYGTQYGEGAPKKPSLKENLVAGLFQQALAPRPSFISQYINEEPYLQGQAASTYDYLQGLL